MMVQAQQRIRRKLRSRPKERSKEEQDLINEAKALLMERNNMTESEADVYKRQVHLSTVHQDYIPGDQWVRASFYYIGHISGKKDHDLEEIMVVEVVSP